MSQVELHGAAESLTTFYRAKGHETLAYSMRWVRRDNHALTEMKTAG